MYIWYYWCSNIISSNIYGYGISTKNCGLVILHNCSSCSTKISIIKTIFTKWFCKGKRARISCANISRNGCSGGSIFNINVWYTTSNITSCNSICNWVSCVILIKRYTGFVCWKSCYNRINIVSSVKSNYTTGYTSNISWKCGISYCCC